MDGKQIVAGFVLLILVYLLVINSAGTNKVIKAMADGIGGTVKALQGR